MSFEDYDTWDEFAMDFPDRMPDKVAAWRHDTEAKRNRCKHGATGCALCRKEEHNGS